MQKLANIQDRIASDNEEQHFNCQVKTYDSRENQCRCCEGYQQKLDIVYRPTWSAMKPLQFSKNIMYYLSLSIIILPAAATPLHDLDRQTLQNPGKNTAAIADRADKSAVRCLSSTRSHPQAGSNCGLSRAIPNSLSRPEPNSLSSRSLAYIKGYTYRVLESHFIEPVKVTAQEMYKDLDATMRRIIRYVEVIDSHAPSTHFTLSCGSLRMKFWSPAFIAWTFVTGIIKLYLTVGMMFVTFFSRIVWQYLSLTAVTVLLYAIGDRPDRVIPV